MEWIRLLFSRLANSESTQIDLNRWIMVDVETSGLRPERDEILSIAALAMEVDFSPSGLRLKIGDSFDDYIASSAAQASDAVLIHGIGLAQQACAMPAEQVLRAFAEYCGQSPLLGFHCAFDQAMLSRLFQRYPNYKMKNPWADIEQLCRLAFPKVNAQSLDHWLEHFRIPCLARHQAAADCFAQAELLQCIWPSLVLQCKSWRDVAIIGANAKYVRG